MSKILSFDAETDGLWGQPFAIAAIVYEYKNAISPASWYAGNPGTSQPIPQGWIETARFLARLSDDVVKNDWVKENVLPAIQNVDPTHETYEDMLRDFSDFYMQNKNEADVICHMGFPVEAHLLREMHRLGFIGDWDGPFPLIDIAGNLKQSGENPKSVDEYAKKHALKISDYGSTHNPLYDCEVAARSYINLTK